MPTSIEGTAPSVVQARATRSLYDPQRGFLVAGAREAARGAGLTEGALREEIALKTAALYLDLERTVRALTTASRQVEQLGVIEAAVRLRVEEGRELPVEAKRAQVNLLQGRRRVQALGGARDNFGRALALALGLPPSQQIAPAMEQRPQPVIPSDEEAFVAGALSSSREIRRLESDLAAKNLEAKSFRALRRPRMDLVAQYGLFSHFNNYEEYFNKFQRHNFQLGMSLQVPLFANASDEARAAQSEVDARRIRTQISITRGKVESDARRSWQALLEAETARELARLDLDVSREQVSVLLAQNEEGRATMKQIEEARFQEQERWMALYDASAWLERARLDVLRQASQLVAALDLGPGGTKLQR
jgi:outer membrane protein TolC